MTFRQNIPALLVCGAILLPLRVAHAVPEPAMPADEFVDRIGLATHWGYTDTPYGYAYDKARQLLSELGVRHVRDSYHPRERDLWENFGIKTTMIVGPQQPLDKTLQTLRESRDFIAMIEGPNEVDIFPTSANYKGQGFPAGPMNFQNDLYAALEADPLLKNIEVIAPSTARNDSNLKLAPLTSFDYLVMHPYAGGELPSSSLEGAVINNVLNATRLLGGGQTLRPIVVTESGYHTALGANQVIAGVQPGISEATQAKYLPRHFAEYFNAGIRRTITYEFINEFKDEATNAEASFGIVRRDLTPKPAYTALQNLISVLSEAKWDKEKKAWQKPQFTPRALDYTLNAPPTVHHTLLQKSNGDFYLLLWNEVSSYDTKNKTDIENKWVDVSIDFKTPTSCKVFNLEDGASHKGNSPLSFPSFNNIDYLSTSVTDEIRILLLRPQSPKKKTPVPATPRAFKGVMGSNSVAFSWAPVKKARGYFVWRTGRYVGFTAKPTFSDTNLQPNTGYPYEISAVDFAGNISDPASIVAMTKNEFPDLVVTQLSWTPNAQAGTEITLSATVKNTGLAASPTGITHGVAFYVDDQFVSWSDTFNKSLAPGESITLTSNNGPKGKATFTAATGAHKLRAVVDDVNRINESDENNNTREEMLTIQ